MIMIENNKKENVIFQNNIFRDIISTDIFVEINLKNQVKFCKQMESSLNL